MNVKNSDLGILSDLNLPVEFSCPLSNYTTFQLGGPCHALIQCATPSDLEKTVQLLCEEKLEFILIGGGSNLVVSDFGLCTIVIRYHSLTPLIERDKNDIVVSGSTGLDALALFCANEGLVGLNYTTGIPGTVGGAIIGNAGAWGKQVGDVLTSVTLIDLKGKTKIVEPEYCRFQYRHSYLKESGDIVLSARFVLKGGDPIALARERADILKKREERHPNLKTYPCAGSFFRNIEPTSKAGKRQATGFFLEEAGGKSLKIGGAEIFEKHANIIVKRNGCTSQNVHDISVLMKELVKKKFNLDIVREVRFVGKFKTDEEFNETGFW